MGEAVDGKPPAELMVDFIISLDGYASAEGWPGFWGLEGPEYLAWLEQEGEKGRTIIMVEHVMDAIRALCYRCIVMNAGRKIADGPTAETLKDPEVVRAYLGDGHA